MQNLFLGVNSKKIVVWDIHQFYGIMTAGSGYICRLRETSLIVGRLRASADRSRGNDMDHCVRGLWRRYPNRLSV